jgi:flagellar motor switch protein FliN
MTDVAAAPPGGSEPFAGVDAATGGAPTLAQAPGMAGAGVVAGPLQQAHGLMDAAVRALPLEALHDVELHVEVVLGRARMALRDLLAAHPGTTIELDRAVHSTVDVMVNGTLFARGEMVVVDDSEIGVQITEVIGADGGRDGRS